MSTALVALNNIQLPAHLQGGPLSPSDMSAAGGISAGGFPRISIRGSKFHVIKDGEAKTIMNPADPSLPLMRLEAVIVGWNPNVSKTYYEGEFNENESDREPDCRSDDGAIPDSDVPAKQHENCSNCPQNAWGSKISKATGKAVKACQDNKRLAIVPSAAIESEALAILVTPAALKAWKAYVDALTAKQIPIYSVVTHITFDTQAAYPKLQFSFGRFLNQEEYTKIQARRQDDDVLNISKARQSLPAPKPLPIGVPPASKPVEKPAETPVSTKPAIEGVIPTPQTIVAINDPRIQHLDSSLKTAIVTVGIDTPGGQAILAAYPAPKPAAPVDPYAVIPEGVRAALKAAIEASGGPDSPGGKAILGQYQPKQETKRRGRPPAQQAPAAQPAPAQPQAPAKPAEGPIPASAQSFVSGPTPPAASLSSLDEVLRKAMATPAQ